MEARTKVTWLGRTGPDGLSCRISPQEQDHVGATIDDAAAALLAAIMGVIENGLLEALGGAFLPPVTARIWCVSCMLSV